MFTARYGLGLPIKRSALVFKGLIFRFSHALAETGSLVKLWV